LASKNLTTQIFAIVEFVNLMARELKKYSFKSGSGHEQN
jgi:hypothetical protein